MLSITGNKGFALTFANGNTVSVQFGPGNYCEKKYESYDAPENAKVNWSSQDAEVAAWDADNNWHNFGYDQVSGYMSSDEVLKFINFVANNKLDTTNPFSSADDDEDEVNHE